MRPVLLMIHHQMAYVVYTFHKEYILASTYHFYSRTFILDRFQATSNTVSPMMCLLINQYYLAI